MPKRWFGVRDIGRAGFVAAPDTSLEFEFVLPSSTFNEGDTILRQLFGWRIQTDLSDDAAVPSNIICPAFVALAFVPDPGGEPWGGAETPGGAALCREMVSWEVDEWTDGTTHARRWYANSYQLISTSGERTINFPDVDKLVLSFGFDHSMAGFDHVGIQAVDATVMLWAEYLVLLK